MSVVARYQRSLSNFGDKTPNSVALYRFIQCNAFPPAGEAMKIP